MLAGHTDATTVGLHDFAADDFLFGVGAAFNQYVWAQAMQQPVRGFFVEHNHVIDARHRCQYGRSVPLVDDGALRPLQPPHAFIAIDGDD